MNKPGYALLLIALLCMIHSSYAVQKYGNYTDARIGDQKNQNLNQLLFFPDREWLYDFDTENPLSGVSISSGNMEASADYYMTKPQSATWKSEPGTSVTFIANIPLPAEWRVKDFLSLGLFQEDVPTGDQLRVFKVKCISASNTVLHTRTMYLRKGGWNILNTDITGSSSQTISKVRITQTAGAAGKVYLDNLMIYAGQNTTPGVSTRGIEDAKVAMENKSAYPTTALTDAERSAFMTIAERVIPLPPKVGSISSSQMQVFRDLHHYYQIEPKGEYANGLNPLYYYRSFDKLDAESVSTLQYSKNSDLNQAIKALGKAWYQTQDVAQKEELGQLFTHLIKLTLTYGGMPNPWYNGRGYAEGVYYAKDLLEKEGLLQRASNQLIQQYHVDEILYRDHRWNLLLEEGTEGEEGATFWQTSCDDLNTANKSTILSLLTGADNAEKARNLRRLKSWLDHLALTFAPHTTGALKPDGSLFHHWGNRFDNYGWTGAWRGATEYVWWMSHTPFEVNPETKERMHYMADVHFEVMNKDGYVGPQDAMQQIPSEGFMNLAMAGSADGTQEMDSAMASYWLAYPNDKSYQYNAENVSKIKAAKITVSSHTNSNLTLSYDVSNVHRYGHWQVYTRGVSKDHYHTQYERNGFLFYNIGGISLCKEGSATGMQGKYGTSLLLRHSNDEGNLTAGYNLSRALGVTSVQSDFDALRQRYYQKGSSAFVGGLSTSNGKGIFVQEFDARKNASYNNTVASSLSFRKSYFYFGNDIVALASDISNGGDLSKVETGLLQEPSTGGANTFTFANNLSTTGDSYQASYTSNEVPWFVNTALGTGIYLFPGQQYQLFKGTQNAGRTPGEIISTYLKHASNTGYSFIVKLETDKFQMSDFSQNMQSGAPKYEILERNSTAHVIRHTTDHTTAYAIFDAQAWKPNYGPINKVSKPCVLMAQERKSEAQITLSVSDPDKHMDKNAQNPMGWSMPSVITVNLRGPYKLGKGATKYVQVHLDAEKNVTEVTFTVKEGLSAEVVLQEDREQNSLPWIEDFIHPNETTQDQGLSSWSLTAFEPQAVGFSYVMANDLWMSGTNADWESGLIDISSEQEVSIAVSVRCEEPKRINSNDSLCIYYQVDDQTRQVLKTWVDDFEAETVEKGNIEGNRLKLYIEGRSDRNYAAFVIERVQVSKTVLPLQSVQFEQDTIQAIVGVPFTPSYSVQPEEAKPTVSISNSTPWLLTQAGAQQFMALKQGLAHMVLETADGQFTDEVVVKASYPLVSNWKQISVGSSFLGNLTLSGDQMKISGNGSQSGTSDNLHAAVKRVSGDFDVFGHLLNFDKASNAGFIAKSDSTSAGTSVAIFAAQSGVNFRYRSAPGNTAQEANGKLGNSSVWLRLTRKGSRTKAYESMDGENWDLIRSTSLDLGQDIMVGFFVNGPRYPQYAQATFEEVTLAATFTNTPKIPFLQARIYPNPTQGILHVVNASAHNIEGLALLSLNGKCILKQTQLLHRADQANLNLRQYGLRPGIYLLQIWGADEMHTEKVVLQ